MICQEPSKELELRHPKIRISTSLKAYAGRFLKCNGSLCPQHAEAPKTPDRVSDSWHLEMPPEEKLKEVWAVIVDDLAFLFVTTFVHII